MKNPAAASFLILGALSAPVFGQTQRRAAINPNVVSGQSGCTIEVVVDGAAEIEVRGDTANLRNLSGQAPQWRRFECTERMPVNPENFELRGVPGRGGIQLTNDPRSNGVAVIRIQDPEGGAQTYSFGIFWTGSSAISGGQNDSIFSGQYPNMNPNNRRANRGRLTQQEAVQLCQDAVRQRSSERWGSADVTFHSADMTDSRGARDRVTGTFSANANRGWQNSAYSCDVNTNNGRILNVQIDDRNNNRNQQVYGDRGGATSNTQAMRNCERAVSDRVRNEGYQRVRFGATNIRGAQITGSARADRANGADSFDFTCEVYNGSVQVTELNRR